MKKTEVVLVVLSLMSVYCRAYDELANSKIVANRTGHEVMFTYHVYKMDSVYWFPLSFTYLLIPDTIQMPRYPGTKLRGISWDEVGSLGHYTYSYDDINTATTIVLKPRGEIELH